VNTNIKLNRIKQLLTNKNEGILLTCRVSRQYFAGCDICEGLVLLTQNANYYVTDSRYFEALQKTLPKEFEAVEAASWADGVFEKLKEQQITLLYLEAEDVTVALKNKLQTRAKQMFGNGLAFDTTGLLDLSIANLRVAKTAQEIEKIKHAQAIAEKSFEQVLNYIKPGVQERKIALELEYLMKKNGADCAAFELITLTGENTSVPHGVPGKTKIKQGDLFQFDIGARVDGYNSDMSRVVCVGQPSQRQSEVFDIVLQAQLIAIAAAQPGIYCSDVDLAARSTIEKAGFGGNFCHSTGHGVGLCIHESPSVSAKSKVFLSPVMVITVEPGMYLPGEFGVRIEDMLLIAPQGSVNLTNAPKELICL
jgi:Xaa-Pro aminopeptidase